MANEIKLDQQIIDSLQKLHEELHCRMQHAVGPPDDLTIGHVRALILTVTLPRPTMSDLAQGLKITKASTNALVTRLVARGLITRKVDAKDKRIVRLSLTAKAKNHMARVQKEKTAIVTDLLTNLNATDKRQLAELLSKLTS